MQQTVFAVVAQAVNYRDHDRILTLVTRERGTVTATARGLPQAAEQADELCPALCLW